MRLVWLFLLAIASAAAPATAQITADGTIRGYIRDQQGAALPGATVTLTGVNVAGSQVATSDSTGHYRLLNLAAGEYALQAELQGFSRFRREGLVVRAGLNLAIDINLQVGKIEETVQVRSETPMLEVEKPTQGVNISGDFQRSLPLGSRRDWSDFLELTPGVTSRTINNPQGGQMYLLRGGEIDGHVFQVDGADLGSFRQTLPTYLGLSNETISDVQVKTGGLDASAPLGTGVVVNIATQSGTNRLKGAGATAITPKSWNGDNTPTGTSAINELFQVDASLGGPIVKDRAWYYGSFKYTHRETGIFRDSITLNNLRALVPGFEPFDNESNTKYYFAKATTQLSPKHQLLAFWQRDINPEDSNFATSGSPFSSTAFGGSGYNARLSSVWSNSVMTRVSVSYNDKSFNRDIEILEKHLGSGPARSVNEQVFPQAGALVGSGSIAELDNVSAITRSPTTKLTIQGDVTWYKAGWLGAHEFQAGVFLQPHLKWVNESFFVNDGFISEQLVLRNPADKAGGFIPFARTFVDATNAISTDVNATDNAIYFQDAWKPTPRLTVTLGVRADRVTIKDNIADAVLQESWDVGPRLGATYAIDAARQNIARGSWTRIHEQPYAFSIPTGVSNVVGSRTVYDVDLNGTFETEFVSPARTVVSRNQIDPEKHMHFADEWILGYRRQLPGQTSVDVSFVRRNWRDRPAFVDINGIYDGGVFQGYRDPTANAIFRITNNEWNWFVYSGLELTVTRRTRNLQMIAGYTRAWDHISGTWQPFDPASIIEPEKFANDRGIGSFRGGQSDSNSYTNIWNTRNSSWQDHQLRLAASYLAPYGILLGSNYTLLSGPYTGPIIDRIAAGDPRFGPATLTLSNGRVVQNPLSTRDRFVFETRGEGQIKLPTLHVWNIRVGRMFRFGGQRLDASFDVFNVTNNDAFQEFFIGQSNVRYSPFYIIGPDGNIRGNNRQFARAGQVLLRWSF
jgi:hypothetical protein